MQYVLNIPRAFIQGVLVRCLKILEDIGKMFEDL